MTNLDQKKFNNLFKKWLSKLARTVVLLKVVSVPVFESHGACTRARQDHRWTWDVKTQWPNQEWGQLKFFFFVFGGKIGRNFFVQLLSAQQNCSQRRMQRIGTRKNLVETEPKTKMGQFGVRSWKKKSWFYFLLWKCSDNFFRKNIEVGPFNLFTIESLAYSW